MITIPTFPLRPLNGGKMEHAIAKRGAWLYERKWNGWRVTVHTPTGTCWNRHGQPLSISHEFTAALATVRGMPFEFLDCEGLERRHNIGRGTLIVLDCMDWPDEEYHVRRARLDAVIPVHLDDDAVPTQAVIRTPCVDESGARGLYASLRAANVRLGAELYEGLVAKRADSKYPRQLANAERTFHLWMKHRWN